MEQGIALAEWVELSDALMRGLVHALNNRITALSAFAELVGMGDEEFTPERVLPGELTRLHQVNGLFRLLVPDDPGPEALELLPVLDDALALHAHHPRLRSVRLDVRQSGTIVPLRVPRWALLRLLLMVMEFGKRNAEAAQRTTSTVRIEGDDDFLVISADTGGVQSHYTGAMALRCGGSVSLSGDDLCVRLPTLLQVRRAERVARG